MRRKQTDREIASRNRNFLLGQIKAAEAQFNRAIGAALRFSWNEYCILRAQDETTLKTYQGAVSSMAKSLRGRVEEEFQRRCEKYPRRGELLPGQIVEPTQDFSH